MIEQISHDTGIPIKELNRINRNKWYHGTTIEGAENIKKIGVIANYNYGSELDFGVGFYLTDTYEKANSYISKLPITNEDGSIARRTEWAVMEFEINPFEILFLSSNNYKFKNFNKHNDEFAKFSFDNRLNNVYNEKPHGYDIIWGVMSDSLPVKLLLDYKNGNISYEDAISQLQKPNSMKQLYIGRQEICDKLIVTQTSIIKEVNDNE